MVCEHQHHMWEKSDLKIDGCNSLRSIFSKLACITDLREFMTGIKIHPNHVSVATSSTPQRTEHKS
jgi:hypothetical protein